MRTTQRSTTLSTLSLALLLCTTAHAQKYWTGGSGNWENADHWSLQPNGPGGAGVPTSNEDAVIDPTVAVVVSIPADAACKSLRVVGDDGAVTIAGLGKATVHIGGNWWLEGDVQWQHPGTVVLDAKSGEHTVATGPVRVQSDVVVDGNAVWNLGSALVMATDRSLTLRKGTWRTNDRTMEVGKLCSEGRGTKRLEAGGSIIQTKVFEADAFKADVDVRSGGLLVNGEAQDWNGRRMEAEQLMRAMVLCGTGAGQTPFNVTATMTTNYNGFGVSCNGACDGAVIVNITGGIGPFSIQWQGGPSGTGTSLPWANLCRGNRLVVVTDQGQGVGCFASVNVTEPPPISVLFFGLNPPSCANSCNGSAITFPGGGTESGFVYNWNNGAESSPNPTQLCAGVNTLEITDSNGCVFDTTFTLNVLPIDVVPTSTNVTCFGACDGTATVAVTGGTGAITYDWTPGNPPGDGSNSVTGLCAGPWSVLIADANGCDTIINFTITEPLPIEPNATSTAALCANSCDGSATAAPTGGSGNYGYLWTPGGAITATANGLCAGNYTVLITDNVSGCDTLVPVTITAPAPIVPTIVVTDATCSNLCDGVIGCPGVVGGTAPYTFLWAPGAITGQGTPTASDLCPGNYTLLITDAAGCDTLIDITINAPPPIVPDTSWTDVTCAGACDGTANAPATGGTGTLVYAWTPAVAGQGTPNATGLCAGNYSVTITDDNGCDTTVTFNIVEPLPITGTPTITNVSCAGECDGAADVVITGGTPNYTYVWAPPPGAGQGTPNASQLCAGNYTLIVTDANGCQAIIPVVITEPPPFIVSFTSTPVSCGTACDGAVDVIVSGGTPDYDYLWTPPPATGQGTANATGFCEGPGTVLIIDDAGCDTLINFLITAPPPILPNEVVTNVTCNGGNDGSITTAPTGGSGSYTWTWTPVPGNGQGNSSATGLTAGIWTVLISDGTCDTTLTITITEPPPFDITSTVTDATCNGDCDGSIDVTATGGTGVLTYTWAPNVSGQGTPNASLLCAGAYTLTIADAVGCDTTLNFTIAEPPPIVPTLTITDAGCGQCNGTASVTTTGGVGTLDYSWAPPPGAGQGTPNATGLCPDNYTLTIVDDNGCDTVITFVIAEPPPLVVTITTTPASCNNQCDGTANAGVTGGTPDYDYVWTPAPQNGQGTANATGFCPGPGTLLVTDDLGCDTLINFLIIAPPPILPNEAVTNVTCNGGNDGSIITAPTGGSGSYTYTWTPVPGNGQGNSSATGLDAGTWSVTISDGSCDTTLTIDITEPPPFDISSTVNDATCNGECNGSIVVQATGGNGVLTYTWAPNVTGQGTPNATLLCAGTYALTIADAAGCDTTLNFTIAEPPPLQPALSTTLASCGLCDGTATVDSVPGAVGNLDYDWQPPPLNGQGTANATGFCPGPYTVTITDGNGCDTTLAFIINTPSGITVTAAQSNVSCAGACDGVANVVAAGGLPPYDYTWNPPVTGQGTPNATGLCEGTYTVTIGDSAQCDTTIVFTIGGPAPINPGLTFTNETCNGPCDGTATVNPTGGSGVGFVFLWSPGGQNTPSVTGLCAGPYSVTIIDDNGCDTTVTFTVLPQQPVDASLTITNGLCHNECNGEAVVTTSGLAGPYTYFWDPVPQNGQGDSIAVGLCEGGGIVTVTDANGCDTTIVFDIFKPGPIEPNLVVENEDCTGSCTGQAAVFPFGGTGSFTFLWQPGGQTTDVVTGLCAGSYTVTITDSVGCDTTVSFDVLPFDPIVPNFSTTPETCPGSCDGTATLGPTGGEPPYTYIWNPIPPSGDNQPTASGLCAGTYTVTIIDASGCDTIVDILITSPPALDLGATVSDVLCAGEDNGEVVLNVTGGNGGYTYNWTPDPPNGDGTNTASGLTAGAISVIVADANGCDTTVTFTINEPLPLSATGSSTPSQCLLCNGTATVNVTGGTGLTFIAWIDPNFQIAGFGNTLDSLCAGVYIASIADQNGCLLQQAVPVIDSDGEVITAIGDTTSCPDVCDGTVEVQFTCNDPACSIAWFGGNGFPLFQFGNTVSNLCAGTYYAEVTNNSGCVSIDTAFVVAPDPIVANISTTPVTCAGDCDGTATVGPTGGTGPYAFNWSPDPISGDGTPSVDSLCAGVYTVLITDFTGCDTTVSVLILEPQPLTVNAVQTDLLCSGDCNASIVATVNGGTGNITYDWTPDPPNGDGTNSAFQLCAGTYDLAISDANGCDTTVTFTIADPQPIVLNITTTPSQCQLCNGTVNATTTGGTGNVVITWTLSGLPVGTGNSLTNLCAGVYTATATDDNGCSTTQGVVITDSGGEALTMIDGAAGCAGECSGIVEVQFNCSVPSCTIDWYDALGNNINQPGQNTVDSLCAGTYIVMVTNGDGCASLDTAIVSEPIGIAANISTTPATCAGTCDGTATAGPVGGVPPYSFDWGPGVVGADTTAQVNGLCAGVYTLTITDNAGCDTTVNVLILEPQPIAVTATQTDVSCNGACDGSIDLVVTGGSGVFTFDWSPDPVSGDGTASVSALCAGSYDVTISDSNGCDTTITYTITEPLLLSVTSNPTQSQCQICNGTAAALPVGGTGPYSYQWTLNNGPFSTDSALVNLCAGLYGLTVTDANGCSATIVVAVTDTDGEVLTPIDGVTSCPNVCDGVAGVNFNCGIVPCTIEWYDINGTSLNQPNTLFITGLCAGGYLVEVTNGDGCVSIDTVNVISPDPIVPNISTSPVLCAGECNGTATAGPTGGTGTYTFDWSPDPLVGDGTSQITQLCAGTYTVFISDGLCDTTETVLVTEPLPYAISATIDSASCFLFCDGSIDLLVSGGTGQYTIDWSPDPFAGDSTLNVTVCAGTYSVSIVDANGCDTVLTYTVGEPLQLEPGLTTTDVACFGDCQGSANLQPTGGTGAYETIWYQGLTTLATNVFGIDSLCPGTNYAVVVSDANGCSITTPYSIGAAAAIVANLTFTGETCNGPGDGEAHIAPAGGSGTTYGINWDPDPDNGDGLVDALGLEAGNYTVTITDSLGCDTVVPFTILPYQPIVDNAVVSNVLCNGECNGIVVLSPSGGFGNYTFDWNPDPPNGDGTNSATGLCAGPITVTITDGIGCDTTITFTITEPAALTATVDQVVDALCSGATDGSIAITVVGGVPNYDVVWSGPNGFNSTSEDITGLAPGVYTANITDDNNCTVSVSATVGAITILTADAGADVQACSGNTITLDGSNSAGAVDYSWSTNGGVVGIAAQYTLPNLGAGTYTYILTITNGPCTDSDTVLVTILASPLADAGPDQEIFLQQSTTLGGNPTGPPGSSYVWQPDSLLDDANVANPVADPPTTTWFTVEVTGANGCTSIDSALITVIPEIVIPTGFSPNGDGVNDTWQIDLIERFPECTVEIYNRWGELLFRSVGYQQYWDGTYNDGEVPIGTYYYAIELNDPAFPEPYTGPLTVLR